MSRPTPCDQIVMLRVRNRLAAHGLTLRIRRTSAGWRWSIHERPGGPPRPFESLHQALDHADAYTAVWYPEPTVSETP